MLQSLATTVAAPLSIARLGAKQANKQWTICEMSLETTCAEAKPGATVSKIEQERVGALLKAPLVVDSSPENFEGQLRTISVRLLCTV